jgi:hypothetical protein
MSDRAEPEPPTMTADSPAATLPSDPKVNSDPEISRPMLEVHAPHEPIQSWKGFTIHIATITIGLLIAIGLEQLVEYFHHRHQAAAIVGKLRAESYENIVVVRSDVENCDQTLAAIKAIGDSLDPKTKASPAPPWMPPVLPEARIFKPSDAQWLIARDGALLQFLPPALVANYWKIEVTREHADAVYSEARRSRLKLNALLDVYAGQAALNSADVLSIRLALSEYAQFLRQVKTLLQHVAEANQITLDDKVIDIGMASKDIPLEQ